MGGKSAKAPDYSGMQQVANQQLQFSRQQYNDMKPIVEAISQQQMAAQQQQMDQAKDYYDYQQETFRPVEEGLVADAQNFNTEEYREQQASQAAASDAQASGLAREASNRAMSARGVNPNSGAARGGGVQARLQDSARRAASMTGARNQAQQVGYARRLDAAGLGRGLAGASSAAYANASNAGAQASNVAQSAGNNFQAGLSNAGSTYGAMAGTQASVYNNSVNAQSEMFGAGIGAAATVFSDMRLKENVEEIGKDAYTGLNLYHFSYIADPDSTLYEGVMAQEVLNFMPEAVVLDEEGYYAVDYGMLGMTMKEVEVA
jgi:hypothetical protein